MYALLLLFVLAFQTIFISAMPTGLSGRALNPEVRAIARAGDHLVSRLGERSAVAHLKIAVSAQLDSAPVTTTTTPRDEDDDARTPIALVGASPTDSHAHTFAHQQKNTVPSQGQTIGKREWIVAIAADDPWCVDYKAATLLERLVRSLEHPRWYCLGMSMA